MTYAELEAIPDGPVGQLTAAKAAVAAVMVHPKLEDQLSALVGAIMLVARHEPDHRMLLLGCAAGLRVAALLRAVDAAPPEGVLS